MDCLACTAAGAATSSWTGYALFAGALVACPCHLPITIGLLAALGLGSFVVGAQAWVYAVFSILFLAAVLGLVVWGVRTRDAEKLHVARHAPDPR